MNVNIMEQTFCGHKNKRKRIYKEDLETFIEISIYVFLNKNLYQKFQLFILNSSRENHILPMALWTDGQRKLG